MVKLKSEHIDGNELSQWLLWRKIDGKIIISLRMLETGRYAMEIFAGKEGMELLHHISTYLVNVPAKVPKRIKFPEIPNQHAGETKANSK